MKDTAPFHVLLAEDNPGDAQLFDKLLKEYDSGTKLARVTSVASAREYIAQAPYLNAVFFDLSLPDASGLGSLRSVNDVAPHTPVIVLAGPDDEELAMQAVREGADDYLIKSETDARVLKKTLCHSVERKQTQDPLQREKSFSAALLRNSYDGVAVVSGSGRFKFISPAMRSILHLEPDEDSTLDAWISNKIRKQEQRDAFSEWWRQLRAESESYEMILEIIRPSGGRHWSRLRLAPMAEDEFIINGQDVTLSIQTQDQLTFINELLAKQNEQLQQMATTDQLTGVLNRSALRGIAGQQWSRAVRKGEPFSVILMDIDRFENVNNTHGHLVGDMALERMGHMLNTLTRAYDLIGRWAGEEFLVVLPGTSIQDAVIVAERMRTGISDMEIYVDDKTSLKITCSFGVAGRDATGVTQLDSLFLQAEKALHCAKENGRNRVCQHAEDNPAVD